ncbi:transporter substrate-binding domain-containing protein [Vibrio coralliilyticus]|uniref:transporter substrate-binding domain-containing protein n=1 Tax=Vibrio coralliilyticus TaxID=190893 RepID=UPI000BAC23C1|nr:transporter substrate-binding domain-containing protein [Vibrio coralliilyticus]NOI74108.1 transporter substrate-binding domain-containing protein [Vibrio coralliilyticus]PAW04716.1 polar amino acid uptake family ABC transporter substrate-binding protein [Vibrio coralliilyticus]
MIRFFTLLISCCLLLPSVQAQDLLSKIKQSGRIVIGVKADYPPWGMLDSNNQPAGFEPDLAQMIGHALNAEVEFKTVTSANRFQKLNEGQVDMLIATVGDSMQRRQRVRMITPHYFRSGVTALTHKSNSVEKWTDLIGKPVCLTAGAYFNKSLVQNYRIKPIILMSNRDSKLALLTNKCQAWAYDSGILFHLSNQKEWSDYSVDVETIMPIHWSMVTRKDTASQSLANWLSRFIASRIRDGRLKSLAQQWQLPEQDYLAQQHKNWNSVDENGDAVCQADSDKVSKKKLCFDTVISLGQQGDQQFWPFDQFDTERLIQSMLHTALFTVISILTAIALALGFTQMTMSSKNWVAKPIAFLTHLQSSIPPILMLYLIYFGALSFWNEHGQHWLLSGASVAWLVLALYTASGINNLVTADVTSPLSLTQRYLHHSAGVKANLVNLAKAAGMASVIASPNAVLVVNTLVSSSGYPVLLMTLLALFYYLEVLLFAYLVGKLFTRYSDYLKRQTSPDINNKGALQ